MKKKQVGTIFLVVITVGLIGAIIYFNVLLNDKSPTAVTQIKKTKASAITYHKLLALNTTPIPGSSSSSEGNVSSISSEASSVSQSVSSAEPTIAPTIPIPSPTSGLITYRPASSSVSSVSPTALPTVLITSSSSSVVTGSGLGIVPTAVPTLLVYRTLSPTLIPPANTGGDGMEVVSSSSKPAKVTIAPTRVVPTKAAGNELPQTGWVQISTIFFIVAATTIFVSFLF